MLVLTVKVLTWWAQARERKILKAVKGRSGNWVLKWVKRAGKGEWREVRGELFERIRRRGFWGGKRMNINTAMRRIRPILWSSMMGS